jgi:tRNA nucleotidyltransferase (CCA-adding enzyme)
MGRPPLHVDNFPAGDWLLKKARQLEIEDVAPKPIVMGRHLIELGMKPGPHFGKLLRACYEAQIEGEFLSLQDGIAWIKKAIGCACP